jgi:hypothetical protein
MKRLRRSAIWLLLAMSIMCVGPLAGCSKREAPDQPDQTQAAAGRNEAGGASTTEAKPDGAPTVAPEADGQDQAAAEPEAAKYHLKLDLSDGKAFSHQVSSQLTMIQGAQQFPEAEKSDIAFELTVLQTPSREADGSYACTMSYKDVDVAIKKGGTVDQEESAAKEKQIAARKDTFRFDSRGRLKLNPGEEAGLDVGFGGIVFPERPVAVGGKWEYETKLDLAGLIKPGLRPVPVSATYKLLEVAEKNGIEQAHVTMSLTGVVDTTLPLDEGGAHYEGTVTLTVDAWIELATGIAETATSDLQIDVKAASGSNIMSYLRHAKEKRVRKR